MRHFFKRFVSIILVLSLLLCFMMVPYTVHALGAEMAATLGMATGLGPVAPVIATILLGAGLGVVAANVLPSLIQNFYSSCDSATKADLESMGAAYESAVDAQTEAAAVNLNLTSNVVNAVNNYVSTSVVSNDELSIGTSSVASVDYFHTFNKGANNLNYQAYIQSVYTTIPAAMGYNRLFELVPRSGCYAGIYIYQGSTISGDPIARCCPYIEVPTGEIFYTGGYQPPNLSNYTGLNLNLYDLTNITFSSAGTTTRNVSYCWDAFFRVNGVKKSDNSPANVSVSMNFAAHPGSAYGNKSYNYQYWINCYPFINTGAHNGVDSIGQASNVLLATVNQTYLPTGTLIDGTAADTSKPLTDNTVIAVPVPQYGIEEGVKIPTQDATQWTDEVILYTPEDFRDSSVDPVPPIDVSDNLTWPTAPGEVLNPADADALPNDIAQDLTLDPDAGNPDGEEVSWWFRIPILGALLRALARIWELISQFFKSIGTWFAQLFNNLWNWLKSIFDRLGNIWTLLSQILAKLGQFIFDLPEFLADIFLLISGYTIFQELLDGFLPTVVVSVLWVFWMAALAIWIVRWLADR